MNKVIKNGLSLMPQWMVHMLLYLWGVRSVIGACGLFVTMIGAAGAYYQTGVTGSNPTWHDVAAGAMALVGTLASLGYVDYMSRQRKTLALIETLKKDIEKEKEEVKHQFNELNEKRDAQHRANLAAIITIAEAIKTGDKTNLNIKDLIS